MVLKRTDTLPPINDLQWHNRSGTNITMSWTNPTRTPNFVEKSNSVEMNPASPQAVEVVDYDVRFKRYSTIRTEADFNQAQRLNFSGNNLLSSNTGSKSRVLYTTNGSKCFFSHSFFPKLNVEAPKDLRSQFRERVNGDYAIRYLDAQMSWSKISNVLYDNANGAMKANREFNVRILGAGGFGAFITTGLTVVEIQDAYSGESRIYTVNPKGLSIGASLGGTTPKDGSWVRFTAESLTDLHDFAHMGVNFLSQGVAIGSLGYGRMEMMIYDSERDAAIDNRDAVVAGPINLDGLNEGFEITGLSRGVGRLDPI